MNATAQGEPRYDELSDPRTGLRAHWGPLIDRLRADGSGDTIRRSHEMTRRLIVENGVTYNVYSDPQGADRPWALDPLPFVLPVHEWRAIESGVAQRSRLLNAVLQDLYGAQRLIAEGLVPSELPFGHPNFLWPCHDLAPPDDTWLHVYAADLARAPDGRWWLLADRTQAPSGAGYALENREILEQVHAAVLPDIGLHRVHGFLDAMRAELLQPIRDEAPLAVLLTPGPFNETYFEHAYLARQLGVALVEGSDLTVRGDVVYMKTLAGLKRVCRIFRRLDDDFCDPLELRGDSALGIPGLLGALRAGNVVVANALGTGVLESAAWLGFLPAISERLLGERLLLPEVATWWCGERPALEYVIENLDRLVIKPTYPNQRFEPIFGRDIQGKAREALVARLRHRPYAYVAQEHVRLSQAPVWRSAAEPELSSRALTIRVYALATREGVRVLPGGLARIAQPDAADVVSSQRGGGAKDIWILTPDVVQPAPSSGPAVAPTAAPEDIPSRLVENLYWLGRYAVRCENGLRLLGATLALPPASALAQHAMSLCQALHVVAEEDELSTALHAPEGLGANLRRLAWSAGQVRNRLSIRYWRGIQGLQRELQDAGRDERELRAHCVGLLQHLHAIGVHGDSDMPRDAGWHAMALGRCIEHAQFVAALIDAALESPAARTPDALAWLLESCASLPVHRERHGGAPQLAAVLTLLLDDSLHPASLAVLAKRIESSLAALLPLAREPGWPLVAPPAATQALPLLREQLRTFADQTAALSDRFTVRFFAHIDEDARSLSS